MSASFFALLPWLSIPAAFALDALLGDPRWLPHPVRWMGWAIERAEARCRQQISNERLAGVVCALALIVAAWLLAALGIRLAVWLHPLCGFVVETVLLFYCLSARSLAQAALEIHLSLEAGAVEQARAQVAMIVGRDVSQYQADDIARATVETVAENLVDGVLSPLFFAALGGPALAIAYKMTNTLDSMIGYKNPRYLLFGWAAARIDDAVNWLPARLSPLLIALAVWLVPGLHCAPSTSPRLISRRALLTAWREGSHHASPNAGYPEAAFAGALGVWLNGPNVYHGVLVEKPVIGKEFGAVGIQHVELACALMRWTALLGCGVAWLVGMVSLG
jgi:adenosylcobinamide-phosphate synthase